MGKDWGPEVNFKTARMLLDSLFLTISLNKEFRFIANFYIKASLDKNNNLKQSFFQNNFIFLINAIILSVNKLVNVSTASYMLWLVHWSLRIFQVPQCAGSMYEWCSSNCVSPRVLWSSISKSSFITYVDLSWNFLWFHTLLHKCCFHKSTKNITQK